MDERETIQGERDKAKWYHFTTLFPWQKWDDTAKTMAHLRLIAWGKAFKGVWNDIKTVCKDGYIQTKKIPPQISLMVWFTLLCFFFLLQLYSFFFLCAVNK